MLKLGLRLDSIDADSGDEELQRTISELNSKLEEANAELLSEKKKVVHLSLVHWFFWLECDEDKECLSL